MSTFNEVEHHAFSSFIPFSIQFVSMGFSPHKLLPINRGQSSNFCLILDQPLSRQTSWVDSWWIADFPKNLAQDELQLEE